MSRKKKSRSLKDRLNIKTGSRKDVIASDKKGKIPSKNKLAKHTKRLKSAYDIAQDKLKAEKAAEQAAKEAERLAKEAQKKTNAATSDNSEKADTAKQASNNKQAAAPIKQAKKPVNNKEKAVNPKIEAKPAAKKAMPIANDEFEDHFDDDAADEQSENGFNKLSGDDLFDLFNKE